MKAKSIKITRERITLEGEVVEYELRVSKVGRNLRLTVHLEKGLVVTIPKRATKLVAERFIKEKSAWILKTLAQFEKSKANAPRKHSAKKIKEYKEKARALVAARLAHFNIFYHFPYKNISIRNQKTRWGSCTRKKNLNFNYKIALLEPHLADYIIVHELCHVKEMNHSSKFWDLVSHTIPDYVARRRAIRLISLGV